MVITTARNPDEYMVTQARELGRSYGMPYISRGNLSLEKLIGAHGTVLLLSREHLSCHTQAGQLFLHPNMASVRIKLLRQDKEDKMLTGMDLQPGDSVLDCTAGLCADSLVAKYRVGDEGRVVALEKSLPVYIVVRHGLDNYPGPERFRELSQSIELVHTDFRDYLASLPPKSFDIVYFDPMFDAPVMKASSLLPLRPLACHQPLEPSDIELAARVARKRIVVKQRSSYDFAHLGLLEVRGGQNRKISYGVLVIKENANA
jgi:16S rRNA G966 N2-methylase RsmD